MGLPLTFKERQMRECRSASTGRIINIFQIDVLKFIIRRIFKSLGLGQQAAEGEQA